MELNEVERRRLDGAENLAAALATIDAPL